MDENDEEVLPTQELLRQHLTAPRARLARPKAAKARPKNDDEELFYDHQCNVCKKLFKDKSLLNVHKKIHTDERNYKCTQCGYAGKTKKAVGRHARNVHSGRRAHGCHCGAAFLSPSALKKHQRVHTGEKPYQCPLCPKAFSAPSSLKTHSYIHTNEKPFKCPHCSYACRDSSTLRKHKECHTGTARLYRCKICSKKLKSKIYLKHHIAELHLNVPARKYICDHCKKSFRGRGPLRIHIKIVHDKAKVCICDICGARISNKGNMVIHMTTTHGTARPHVCDICNKKFKDKSGLKKHKRTHTRDSICGVCSRRFARPERLAAHITAHLSDSGVHCPHCPHVFKSAIGLGTHLNKAHKDKQIMIVDEDMKDEHVDLVGKHCKICDISFRKQDHLKKHYVNFHYTKDEKLEEVKQEPVEEEEGERVAVLDLFEVDKQDVLDDVNVEYDNTVVSSSEACRAAIVRAERLASVPEHLFEQYIDRVTRRAEKLDTEEQPKEESDSPTNDQEQAEEEDEKDEEIEEVEPEVPEIPEVPGVPAGNTKRDPPQKIDLYQCYVCMEVFKDKKQLYDHCKDHFDVCNEVTIKRCPICQYVSQHNLRRHMLLMHGIKIKLPSKLNDTKKNTKKSRYFYKVDNEFKRIEVIPSVKNLNKLASMEIDKKNRENKIKTVAKRKLVNNGKDWIVQTETIDKKDYILPKNGEIQIENRRIKLSDDFKGTYLEKLKKLSQIVKKNGKKMLFPCNHCAKICQNVSALTLHFRKHEENPKPFKPKVWKRRIVKSKTDKIETCEPKPVPKSKNRTEIPKPIHNKHKCDKKLMKFYEENIRGGDIEFWQFLKIYNKMSRESINDFSDLANRTDFGFHGTDTKVPET